MPVRIALDYTAAARQGGGIGRYTRELVGAILTSGGEASLVLLTAAAGLGSGWREHKISLMRQSRVPLSFRDLPLTDDWLARLWQRLRVPLPVEWLTGRVEVFYAPDFVLPPLQRRTYALLTVHDLSFLRHPQTFPRALRDYLNQSVPRSVARADHILADSNATRDDLITLLQVSPDKVTTLYGGVSSRFTHQVQPDELARLRRRYGIEAPYILSVGTVQPRKNYLRLMQACDSLAARRDLELVIVGQPAWLAEPIMTAAAQRPYVKMLGFCHDEDLPALYRQAELLAFPSIYEGFGLPPLEAMACGTLVIASAASSVPEVVGGAGILLPPEDVAAWSEALERGLEDSRLRERLRDAGMRRAAQFTWTRAASQWWRIIDSARGGVR